jgi:hypothetical protein
MTDPDYRKSIVPIEYFEKNMSFAKKVADAYDDAKEKNSSWFGPKIPFYITSPKLIDNGKAAHKVLRKGKSSL